MFNTCVGSGRVAARALVSQSACWKTMPQLASLHSLKYNCLLYAEPTANTGSFPSYAALLVLLRHIPAFSVSLSTCVTLGKQIAPIRLFQIHSVKLTKLKKFALISHRP